tara:strand:- start:3092 stop:3868 length:777 start_codon:yes stop_codon:yes gene_type:complete
MTIPTIGIREVYVPNVYIPNWLNATPNVDHLVPPVVLYIGNPIINMPGCVKGHQDNQMHKSGLPKDKNLVEQDPNKAMILCDATIPYYDAMNYEPEQLIITREAPVPNVPPPPTPPTPDVPDTGNLSADEEVPCPGPGQLRVGDLTQAGDEKVTGHELSADGKTCVTLYEPTSAVEKFLPSVNQSTTTVAIAVLATAGAAATPLLLRIIKPIIKKLTTAIQKKLGKKPYRPSRDEIKANQYRQSKGLSPLNFEKMKKG